jgi:hypothetical protein
MSADGESAALLRSLGAAGKAQAADERLDLDELAREFNAAIPDVESQIDQLDRMGLLLPGIEAGRPPMVPEAGRQYLALQGGVPRHVLRFLPHIIDDLRAREALLFGGTVLVDEFRYQLLTGQGVAHVAELVPPALAAAVDEALALNLFAAAVALMARLSEGSPAGCVAEEIIAVELIEAGRQRLKSRRAEEGADRRRGILGNTSSHRAIRAGSARSPGPSPRAISETPQNSRPTLEHGNPQEPDLNEVRTSEHGEPRFMASPRATPSLPSKSRAVVRSPSVPDVRETLGGLRWSSQGARRVSQMASSSRASGAGDR